MALRGNTGLFRIRMVLAILGSQYIYFFQLSRMSAGPDSFFRTCSRQPARPYTRQLSLWFSIDCANGAELAISIISDYRQTECASSFNKPVYETTLPYELHLLPVKFDDHFCRRKPFSGRRRGVHAKLYITNFCDRLMYDSSIFPRSDFLDF